MAPPRRESLFVVRLRDIPPEGTRQVLDLTDEWSAQALAGELLEWLPSHFKAELSLHRTQREVVAHGRLTGGLETGCSRCTAPTRLNVNVGFDLTFVPGDEDERAKAKAKAGDEREMQEDEAETIPYVDEQIDLEPVLREQLILALPYAPLCREDCKGLCARCGSDLNEGPCSCPAVAPEPEVKPDRWAALRDIKL
jgi:uncharacterized protein